MLPIAPGHAVNLKNVVYIKVIGGTTTVYTTNGDKLIKKGQVAANFERAFADARIPILLYSTPSGDQTIISTEHLIELLDDQNNNSVTYKLKGGFVLKIDGGGNFLQHLKTANAAYAEYQPVSYNNNNDPRCAQCGEGNPKLRCKGCKSVYYCSYPHQALHWDEGHQLVCNPPAKEEAGEMDFDNE